MEDIKRVQKRLLEMGKVIHNILTKNNIPYMLAYGSLLGAVRHEGFIPWDDDFDLYLFEDENNSYEKALEILKKELPKDMFLEYFDTEPKYFHAWAHVKDLNTEVVCEEYPQDNSYSHHGLSIDLYSIKKMKEEDLNDYLTQENIKYLERRRTLKLITDEEFEKRVENIKDKKIIQDKRQIISNIDIYGVRGNSIKKMYINEIFPLKKYKFDNFEFFGPNNYDSILKKLYGNYMELPAEENRKPHYSSVLFFK